MNDLILPVGYAPYSGRGRRPKHKPRVYCDYCGDEIDRSRHDIMASQAKRWKLYCGMECKRASQTKYVGMSPKERMTAAQERAKLKKKRKRENK